MHKRRILSLLLVVLVGLLLSATSLGVSGVNDRVAASTLAANLGRSLWILFKAQLQQRQSIGILRTARLMLGWLRRKGKPPPIEWPRSSVLLRPWHTQPRLGWLAIATVKFYDLLTRTSRVIKELELETPLRILVRARLYRATRLRVSARSLRAVP